MDRQAFQERFGLLGDSPAMRRVAERVRQVAGADITVLLEGESGVGKELVATAVHELSKRRHARLVVVNCGSIPEGLVESELFGAERGAYTGATDRRTGYFEEADGGTIFLDEIGEMPLAAQVRLLRVLESGEFSRVGATQMRRTDARVVAATNRDLAAEVRAGRFREDLYYRLSTVLIRIPPLRQRREDILPIVEHYLARFAQKYAAPRPAVTADARAVLERYAWPGNVRELRNVAEQAVVLGRGAALTAEALVPFLRGVSAGLALSPRDADGGTEARERELIYRALLEIRGDLREVKAALGHLAAGTRPAAAGLPPAPGPPAGDPLDDLLGRPLAPSAPRLGDLDAVPYEVLGGEGDDDGTSDEDGEAVSVPFEIEDGTGGYGLGDYGASDGYAEATDEPDPFERGLRAGPDLPTIETAERALIAEALRRFGGNRRLSAEALGISERTLYRKIKELEEADG